AAAVETSRAPGLIASPGPGRRHASGEPQFNRRVSDDDAVAGDGNGHTDSSSKAARRCNPRATKSVHLSEPGQDLVQSRFEPSPAVLMQGTAICTVVSAPGRFPAGITQTSPIVDGARVRPLVPR